MDNYKFSRIAASLDEIMLLNVNPEHDKDDEFLSTIKKIVNNVFIPVTVGGGIYSINRVHDYLSHGADKVIINSIVRKDKALVSNIINLLGSQSVIASIDYKYDDKSLSVFDWVDNKIIKGSDGINNYLKLCHDLEFGEILMNSVNKDGTGFGYDLEFLSDIALECNLPLIAMGGAGKFDHFLPALKIKGVDAVATANLLNFIGDAIPKARNSLINSGLDLPLFQQAS